MIVIAGLGNPEKKYIGTRHNAGFAVIDKLCDKYKIELSGTEQKAATGKCIIDGKKVTVAKPLTYMNLSGESIGGFANFYKLDPTQEIIVVYDDMALDVGQIRVRTKGSAGGHNGIKNIIAHLGGEKFTRIRVGVGEKPKDYNQVDYVLGHFTGEDKEKIEEGYSLAVEAIECILNEGPESAMNKYNTKKKKES